MPKKQKISAERWQELYDLYLDDEITQGAIHRQYKIDRGTISRKFKSIAEKRAKEEQAQAKQASAENSSMKAHSQNNSVASNIRVLNTIQQASAAQHEPAPELNIPEQLRQLGIDAGMIAELMQKRDESNRENLHYAGILKKLLLREYSQKEVPVLDGNGEVIKLADGNPKMMTVFQPDKELIATLKDSIKGFETIVKLEREILEFSDKRANLVSLFHQLSIIEERQVSIEKAKLRAKGKGGKTGNVIDLAEYIKGVQKERGYVSEDPIFEEIKRQSES